MSREAAKIVLDVILRHCAEQNSLWIEIGKVCSEEDLAQYKGMIGRSMGTMFVEVISPIVECYPDLTPPDLLRPPE